MNKKKKLLKKLKKAEDKAIFYDKHLIGKGSLKRLKRSAFLILIFLRGKT